MTPIEISRRPKESFPRPLVRACSSCHGEAGYHANQCPRHDPQTCALCLKIAAAGRVRAKRSA